MYGHPMKLFISNEICYHASFVHSKYSSIFGLSYSLGGNIYVYLLLFTNVSSLFQCENTKKAISKSHQRIHNFSNEIIDHCHVAKLMFYHVFYMILYPSYTCNNIQWNHIKKTFGKLLREIPFHKHLLLLNTAKE